MGSEKDLTVVLEEAATLAAELAGEIGEPVHPALTRPRPRLEPLAGADPLEDPSDLDAQLADLQVLVDDAAAGVEAPSEALDAAPVEPAPVIEPTIQTAKSSPAETPAALSAGAVESSPSLDPVGSSLSGVVGNMPKTPPLASPPAVVENAATEGEAEVDGRASLHERIRVSVLAASDLCVRLLELIDEPFGFVGSRMRTVIGLLAVATVGASVLVAILAILL